MDGCGVTEGGGKCMLSIHLQMQANQSQVEWSIASASGSLGVIPLS